jgi:hypothetical protein
MGKEIVDRELEYILKEMCKRVGADYDSIDFKSQDWFLKYTWTEREQESFYKWLTELIYNAPQISMFLTGRRLKLVKLCKQASAEFIHNYGWKVE